jgi:hypothetical protein
MEEVIGGMEWKSGRRNRKEDNSERIGSNAARKRLERGGDMSRKE